MNILVFTFGIFVMGIGMYNCSLVKATLSTIRECLVSRPIRDSIIALVLTVLVSVWVIEVLL